MKIRISMTLALAILAACSAQHAADVKPTATASATAPAAAPSAPAAKKESAPAKTVTPSQAAAASTPAAPTPATPAAKPAAPAKAATAPKPATAAKAPAPAPSQAAAPTQAAAQTPPAKPAAARLDLKALEERLKSTDAIGIMTKLTLKNQVDDLVSRFRSYHAGSRPPTLDQLRPSFDLLLMKVLSLLQDKDPPLASDIHASREAIWSVLADPNKLAQFT